MTSRSDGTNTTTYAWDEDNRLTLVTLPSSATVAYTYDVAGRMLTRTDSTGTTYFTWDGWNMVAELAPNGTQTRYYAPNGELLYFEVETATTARPAAYGSAYYGQNYYGALVYSVISDGLGSVRRIVDAYNNVISTLDYDSYGNALPSTSDPLGFPYRFVGGLGVRSDVGTGLYYTQHRWYDPTLQRFLSRDAFRTINSYSYCVNNPTKFVDTSGLAPNDPLNPPSSQANPPPEVNMDVFSDYQQAHPTEKDSDEQPGTFSLDEDTLESIEIRVRSHPQCMENCFLVCVRHDGPYHPFLVFPGTSSDVRNEFFGDKKINPKARISPAYVTHDDYDAVSSKEAAVTCKWYCGSEKQYNGVHSYATANVRNHKYVRPESIFWVNDAMTKGGGMKWPVFGHDKTIP